MQVEVIKERPSLLEMTDHYDREVQRLNNIPDVAIDKTRETAIEEITFYGQVQTWFVRTYKVEGGATTCALILSSKEQNMRIIIPPKVTALLVRQVSKQLVKKGRSRRGKQSNAFASISPEQRPKNLAKARVAKTKKAKAKRKSR